MIEQSTGTERATAAIVTSGFWLALTAGRLIVASVGGRLSGVHVLFGCLVLATVGSVILMVGQQSLAVSAGAYLVIGFAFGPIFPTAVAIAGQITPKLASISTSLVITGASFGSMIIPLGQGAAIEHGGVFAGTGVVLAAHVVMLVLMGAGLVVFARRKTVDA